MYDSEFLERQENMINVIPKKSILLVYKNSPSYSYSLNKYNSLVKDPISNQLVPLCESLYNSEFEKILLNTYYKNVNGLWINLDYFSYTNPSYLIDIYNRADQIIDINTVGVIRDLSIIPETLYLADDNYMYRVSSYDGMSIHKNLEDSRYIDTFTNCTRYLNNVFNIEATRYCINEMQVCVDEYKNIDLKLTLTDEDLSMNFENCILLVNGLDLDIIIDPANPRICYIAMGVEYGIKKLLSAINSTPILSLDGKHYTLEIDNDDEMWFYDLDLQLIKYKDINIKRQEIKDYKSVFYSFKQQNTKVIKSIRLNTPIEKTDNVMISVNGVFLNKNQYTFNDSNDNIEFLGTLEEFRSKANELEVSGEINTPETMQSIENSKVYKIYYFEAINSNDNIKVLFDKIDYQKDYPYLNNVLVLDYDINDIIFNNGTFDISAYIGNNYITVPPYSIFFDMNEWNTETSTYESVDYYRMANNIDFKRLRILKV